jgi:hypothetical protein
MKTQKSRTKKRKAFWKKVRMYLLNRIRRMNKLRYMANVKTGEIHDMGNETVCCNIQHLTDYKLIDKQTMLDLVAGNYNGCGHCMPAHNKKKA